MFPESKWEFTQMPLPFAKFVGAASPFAHLLRACRRTFDLWPSLFCSNRWDLGVHLRYCLLPVFGCTAGFILSINSKTSKVPLLL